MAFFLVELIYEKNLFLDKYRVCKFKIMARNSRKKGLKRVVM